MANNRIYLVHKPSLTGIFIGKSMQMGWYFPQRDKSMDDILNDFYQYLEKAEGVICDDASGFEIWSDNDQSRWVADSKSQEYPKVLTFEVDD